LLPQLLGEGSFMSFTVEQISRLHCIPVIDYLDVGMGYGREGNWLLVSAGCGLMMAVMAQEKRFWYCVELDGVKDRRARVADWLIGMEHLVDEIAVVGGWCVSNPKPLADALRALKRPPVVYPTTVNPPHAFDGLPVAQSLSHFSGNSTCGPPIGSKRN